MVFLSCDYQILLYHPHYIFLFFVCFLQFGPHHTHPTLGSDIPTMHPPVPESQVSTIILNRVELLAKNILEALQEIAPSETRSKDMTRS